MRVGGPELIVMVGLWQMHQVAVSNRNPVVTVRSLHQHLHSKNIECTPREVYAKLDQLATAGHVLVYEKMIDRGPNPILRSYVLSKSGLAALRRAGAVQTSGSR